MSETEADALATRVREEHPAGVTVQPDDGFFCVEVVVASGRWTLYDEDDWRALRSRIDDE
jgi:hypothetical protein